MRRLVLSLLLLISLLATAAQPVAASQLRGNQRLQIAQGATPPAAAPPAAPAGRLYGINIRRFSPFPPGTTLRSLITKTIPNFLIAFVGFVFMVFFLINAFRYLLSSGGTEGTTAAKHGMLSAIIGLIVAITAYGVVAVASRWIGQ